MHTGSQGSRLRLGILIAPTSTGQERNCPSYGPAFSPRPQEPRRPMKYTSVSKYSLTNRSLLIDANYLMPAILQINISEVRSPAEHENSINSELGITFQNCGGKKRVTEIASQVKRKRLIHLINTRDSGNLNHPTTTTTKHKRRRLAAQTAHMACNQSKVPYSFRAVSFLEQKETPLKKKKMLSKNPCFGTPLSPQGVKGLHSPGHHALPAAHSEEEAGSVFSLPHSPVALPRGPRN